MHPTPAPPAARHRRHRIAACSVALALIAAACSGAEDEPAATSEPRAEATTTVSAPRKGATVRLLTHDSFVLSDDVLAAFTKETGIEVEILQGGDALAVLNKAILTAGDPEADVLFGVDNNSLTRALDADVFAPYESPALEAVDPSLVVDPHVTPIDRGDVCLNYDVEWFADHPEVAVPEDLDDLRDPSYEGLLVVEDPATSSPGLAFLLATVARFGDDGWESYWEALRDNDVAVSAGWEDAYYGQFSGGAGEGDRPLVVSYATSPAAEVMFAEDPEAPPPTGNVANSCFQQVEYAAVLAGTPQRAEAQALVDFLLSPAAQADIPAQMFVWPARTGIETPPAFDDVGTPLGEVQSLSAEEIGDGRETWIAAWRAVVTE